MNPDGSGQRNPDAQPAHDIAPAWSPDGRKIAPATSACLRSVRPGAFDRFSEALTETSTRVCGVGSTSSPRAGSGAPQARPLAREALPPARGVTVVQREAAPRGPRRPPGQGRWRHSFAASIPRGRYRLGKPKAHWLLDEGGALKPGYGHCVLARSARFGSRREKGLCSPSQSGV
jgi:WD40-like Beta Propeller Repeat